MIRNKQRLLHLYRYLLKYTDEDHQVTTNDLVEFLKQEDANASRKTVKDDIEVLIQEGVDIVTTKSYYNSYFVGDRRFELPEIKFLIDGVAANKSLTTEQKDRMIDKLLDTISVYQAEKLKERLIYAPSRGNEHFYYYIDAVTEAISQNKKIEFQYFDYSLSGEKILKEDGKVYKITPFALRCNNNRFFVFGMEANTRKEATYRLDMMTKATILKEQGDPLPEKQGLAEYLQGLYHMEVGPLTDVLLECRNDMLSSVMDRFCENADIWKSTSDSFYAKVPVCVSNTFYAWVFLYDGGIKIVSPASVANDYLNMVRRAASKQEKKR